MNKIPFDTSIEAEYEDGYVHSETELDDLSPYAENMNVLNDILNKRPEADHGRMVRFSCFYQNNRYDVDWTQLPENARPIRFRHGYSTMALGSGEILDTGWTGVDFGYQWNDDDGQNHQEIMNL